MFDYETLRFIWWLLVGVLLIGFAVMDGHDLGVGILLPFAARDDVERRVAINSVGPHWDGNQVWLLTAGGAMFAAWPLVYAAAFSGFYWAMLAVLWTIFLRPVAFDFRSKIENATWRRTWDWAIFVSAAVPTLVFGVAFGNLLQGVPFHFDANLVPYYTGSFWQLLNPFALLAGVVSVAMITFHGANYLTHRTDGALQQRARAAALVAGAVLVAAFALAGLWVAVGIDGYAVVSAIDTSAASNPLAKSVEMVPRGLLSNYGRYPLTLLVPVAAFAGAGLGILLMRRGHALAAFVASSVAMAGVIGTAAVSMFPFVMPSSTHPGSGLTLWDSTSSQLTLGLMLVAVAIFVPIILAYTAWAYRVMAGKVTAAYIREHERSAY
ncbi:MAG TPA: cytochrome d ubiquinol oxidase subunit II [Usitatibacter sp.]|nr:cytochrome d ubiquinol oxidase subunit II [Usitatibacter sp.]